MNGNYRRELEISRYAGQPTGWFRGEEGRKTCATVMEKYHGASKHSG